MTDPFGEQPQVIDGLQPGCLGRQFEVLTGLRIHPGNLVQPEPQQLDFPGPLLGVPHQLGPFGAQAFASTVVIAVGSEQGDQFGAAAAIQQFTLVLRAAQSKLLGLAVDGHQFSGGGPQLGDRCLDSPYEGP